MRALKFTLAATAALTFAAMAEAREVTLRPTVEAAGAAVTLGDFFTDAGPAAGRAVAPAPGAGQSARFSTRFVAAAARAAGLQWTPPAGVDVVTVTGRGAPAAATTARFETAAAGATPTGAPVAVRRGEIVTLVYVAPGMQLTTRARSTADAGVGDVIRVVNLQSNRTVEATVTGVATASAKIN